ncbi:unnamed protein product, partial [Aphanomyces euteiches]
RLPVRLGHDGQNGLVSIELCQEDAVDWQDGADGRGSRSCGGAQQAARLGARRSRQRSVAQLQERRDHAMSWCAGGSCCHRSGLWHFDARLLQDQKLVGGSVGRERLHLLAARCRWQWHVQRRRVYFVPHVDRDIRQCSIDQPANGASNDQCSDGQANNGSDVLANHQAFHNGNLPNDYCPDGQANLQSISRWSCCLCPMRRQQLFSPDVVCPRFRVQVLLGMVLAVHSTV